MAARSTSESICPAIGTWVPVQMSHQILKFPLACKTAMKWSKPS
jgi:hypothetical protein